MFKQYVAILLVTTLAVAAVRGNVIGGSMTTYHETTYHTASLPFESQALSPLSRQTFSNLNRKPTAGQMQLEKREALDKKSPILAMAGGKDTNRNFTNLARDITVNRLINDGWIIIPDPSLLSASNPELTVAVVSEPSPAYPEKVDLKIFIRYRSQEADRHFKIHSAQRLVAMRKDVASGLWRRGWRNIGQISFFPTLEKDIAHTRSSVDPHREEVMQRVLMAIARASNLDALVEILNSPDYEKAITSKTSKQRIDEACERRFKQLEGGPSTPGTASHGMTPQEAARILMPDLRLVLEECVNSLDVFTADAITKLTEKLARSSGLQPIQISNALSIHYFMGWMAQRTNKLVNLYEMSAEFADLADRMIRRTSRLVSADTQKQHLLRIQLALLSFGITSTLVPVADDKFPWRLDTDIQSHHPGRVIHLVWDMVNHNNVQQSDEKYLDASYVPKKGNFFQIFPERNAIDAGRSISMVFHEVAEIYLVDAGIPVDMAHLFATDFGQRMAQTDQLLLGIDINTALERLYECAKQASSKRLGQPDRFPGYAASDPGKQKGTYLNRLDNGTERRQQEAQKQRAATVQAAEVEGAKFSKVSVPYYQARDGHKILTYPRIVQILRSNQAEMKRNQIQEMMALYQAGQLEILGLTFEHTEELMRQLARISATSLEPSGSMVIDVMRMMSTHFTDRALLNEDTDKFETALYQRLTAPAPTQTLLIRSDLWSRITQTLIDHRAKSAEAVATDLNTYYGRVLPYPPQCRPFKADDIQNYWAYFDRYMAKLRPMLRSTVLGYSMQGDAVDLFIRQHSRPGATNWNHAELAQHINQRFPPFKENMRMVSAEDIHQYRQAHGIWNQEQNVKSHRPSLLWDGERGGKVRDWILHHPRAQHVTIRSGLLLRFQDVSRSTFGLDDIFGFRSRREVLDPSAQNRGPLTENDAAFWADLLDDAVQSGDAAAVVRIVEGLPEGCRGFPILEQRLDLLRSNDNTLIAEAAKHMHSDVILIPWKGKAAYEYEKAGRRRDRAVQHQWVEKFNREQGEMFRILTEDASAEEIRFFEPILEAAEMTYRATSSFPLSMESLYSQLQPVIEQSRQSYIRHQHGSLLDVAREQWTNRRYPVAQRAAVAWAHEQIIRIILNRFIQAPENEETPERVRQEAMAEAQAFVLHHNAAIIQHAHAAQALQRYQVSAEFHRLSGITGFAPVLEEEDSFFSVRGHDHRVSRLAVRLAHEYSLDPEWTAFVGLAHDAGALPFRHYMDWGDRLTNYHAKSALLVRLKEEGIVIPEGIQNDLLNFDINQDPTQSPLSWEAKAAVVAETVEGVTEDILFGLMGGLITLADIPTPLREAGQIHIIADRDNFNTMVADIAWNFLQVLRQGLSQDREGLNDLFIRVRHFKEEWRQNFIRPEIHLARTPPEVKKAVSGIMDLVYQNLPHTGLPAVQTMSRMTDGEVMERALRIDPTQGNNLPYVRYLPKAA